MRRIIAATFFGVFAACIALAADPVADLKKADADWAKAAESRNLDQFVSYIADDAYVSGNDGKWVHGKDAARALWSKMLADPNFKLTWTAESAEVSKDGMFGYTRGSFEGTAGGNPISGSYTTVWKKSKGGKWLATVDISASATP